jgi:hypothetical protein
MDAAGVQRDHGRTLRHGLADVAARVVVLNPLKRTKALAQVDVVGARAAVEVLRILTDQRCARTAPTNRFRPAADQLARTIGNPNLVTNSGSSKTLIRAIPQGGR